jgi:hypothetical protein
LSKRILVIGDCQVKPNENQDHLLHIGRYLVDKKPDIVVCIGDFYDFPSLSSYDKGKKCFEGRRLKDDIEAGNAAMDLMLSPLHALQKRQKENRKKVYTPRMVFTMGNHCDRFDRLANDQPELAGIVGTETLNLEKYGWEVYPFLKPVEIEGIFFVHYLANPMSGKPYAGTALGQLKTVGRSFVVGHKQCLDMALHPRLDGKMQLGIVNGASYPHYEIYKGHVGNIHFRGIIMLNEVEDGFGLPCPVSLDYLKQKYS